MRRYHVAIAAFVVAFVMFAFFVPVISEPIVNACRDPYSLVMCTVQGYESLGYHFSGFGAVSIAPTYYFWITR